MCINFRAARCAISFDYFEKRRLVSYMTNCLKSSPSSSLVSKDFVTSFEEIEAAFERISNDIHKTPVLTSSTLDQLVGLKLHFKCENFQKTGSFKVRGALNAMSLLVERNQKY
jgi:predicted alternative tryptophan synthase beta-subunit